MNDIYFYFHIPFCYKKCPYCSFVSFEKRFNEIDGYVDAVIREIRGFNSDKTVKTVYFGGGTPSILKLNQIERVLNEVYKRFRCDIDEITFETIPLLKGNYLKGLKSLGINRLSIGVQSFNDRKLKILGRIHNKKESLSAVEKALAVGFRNISVDLIYGVGETLDELMYDLDITCKLDIKHVSIYMLSIEEGSEFFKMGFKSSNEEDIEEFYLKLCEVLSKNGFEQYEISNFSKKGFRSKHNNAYWLGYDYKGFGVSASSFLSGKRIKNSSNLYEFVKNPLGSYIVEEELEGIELAKEMFILGLRLKEGIDLKVFKDRYGVDVESLFKYEIDKFIKSGFLKKENGRLFLSSPRAMLVSNAIFSEFI
ncbi:radical SAM family heme chaperone HemW [Hippea maritima]|uniref:Heme chaperone HemW n=1 Tax=Hippea maritima (strain ATCC 700847 / DSM 10411 / MH2) TaxID=760142 RepID=F2LVT8_HIPMA|nr:radical SAM family heme chaperone HemW [Hippea maritima]AEA33872.1 oxygen-independent coproporphyrinogen III oxidase [Hippea maritima DSM 10411]